MKYKFGDIVLISFPSVEANISKKRPALVLLDCDDNDLVVARATSHSPNDNFTFTINNWKDCGLLLPSVVRINKIATLNKNLVYL